MKPDREVGQEERESQHKSQTGTRSQQEAILRVLQTYAAISRTHKVPVSTAKTPTKI
jgi:hypothetical protein